MIETVRVSEKAKIQLINIKKRTGIQNWNVVCRWAFLLSISKSHTPPNEDIVTDSNVEMPWKTFTGSKNEKVFYALLLIVLKRDGIEPTTENINKSFKLHLHRGISFLNAANSNNIANLISTAIEGLTVNKA